jgi:hypothetical protein
MQARKSEISKRSYTISDVETNLNQLVGQLSNMLIFLRNVRCIEIYRNTSSSSSSRSSSNDYPLLLHRSVASSTIIETLHDQSLLQYFEKRIITTNNNNSSSSIINSYNNSDNTNNLNYASMDSTTAASSSRSSSSSIHTSRDGFYKRLLSIPDESLPKILTKLHIETTSYAYNNTDANASNITATLIDTNALITAPSAVTSTTASKELVTISYHKPTANSNTLTTTMYNNNNNNYQGNNNTSLNSYYYQSYKGCSIITSFDVIDYIILTGLCGGLAKRMACQESLRHFKLVPMGAVAACIYHKTDRYDTSSTTDSSNITLSNSSNNNTTNDTNSCNSSSSYISPNASYPRINGQAFCFLPLPVHTKIPMHLNAYWELSSNRRDIWKGDDTTGEAKLRSGKYI